jgi:hypothetical protein
MALAVPRSRRDIRREHNEEQLEYWLVYLGGVPKEEIEKIGSNPNRSTSAQVEANLGWLDALSDPRAQESHLLLSRIVLERMPKEKPLHFHLLRWIYISTNPNLSAPELWRARISQKHGGPFESLFGLLDSAKGWILDELGDHTLTIPSPYEATTFYETSQKNRRIAIQTYFRVYEETDGDDVRSRRAAARESGYSERHIRNIIEPEKRRRRNLEDPTGGSGP